MKKSLIIFFSLFCLNLGAFAVGVDCWEEYTTSNKTEPATSALRTALTAAGATPILVSKIYNLTLLSSGSCSTTGCISGTFHTSKVPFEFISLYQHNRLSGAYVPSMFYSYRYYNSSNSESFYNNFSFSGNSYTLGYSIYTYCVVNNNSSSGGGGGATGSVNFIIKATS